MISNSMPLCDRRSNGRGVKFAPICRLTGDFAELFVYSEPVHHPLQRTIPDSSSCSTLEVKTSTSAVICTWPSQCSIASCSTSTDSFGPKQ
ncbi:hypothetical protein CEXT_156811 [Caerostris extrusa]|uniref:Uncharacterized protein n=1 Tax=Caerostris extrusa TaxID=172846 RepID=A0AAV4PEK5_CAEEX|nr:hypothetical protein CEXT_156811 [Caerostris extrusa]